MEIAAIAESVWVELNLERVDCAAAVAGRDTAVLPNRRRDGGQRTLEPTRAGGELVIRAETLSV